MRVSYNWLKEYVDVPVPPQELADRLTLAGVAVDTVTDLGADIDNVVTGKITKIEKHPNADKLQVCQIDVGQASSLQIITGATNIKEGQVVPVALTGARLAGGLQIKKSKLRGLESQGMLCSGQELGMETKVLPSDQQHGILILPPDTPVAADAKEILGLNDYILELDLTPNRGDCLSMVGVAREVGALYNLPYQLPQPQFTEGTEAVAGLVRVDIADNQLCRRYVARVIQGFTLGVSPLWMQNRLRAAGIRPISNMVDVTNYVMLELGQPLHAFDYDAVQGHHIVVRRANKGEKLVTLDETERSLNEDMLLITDDRGPVGLAGVMGGLNSEVTANTTSVMLESAYFHPGNIRRTSRDLGLRSEASARFEKGLDINGCVLAADRAIALMQALGGGTIANGYVDNYPAPMMEKTIILRPERVNWVLGVTVPKAEIADIMNRLQLRVQEQGDNLLVTVPTYRPDISKEIDLIEEVARIYGYNHIPDTLPLGATTQGHRTGEQELVRQLRRTMVACGLYEVVTYSFGPEKVFDLMNLPADSVFRQALRLQNPLSEDQSVMRTVLVPGLLEVVKRNYNRRVQNCAVFEIGRVFYPLAGQQLPTEVPVLAAVAMGETEGNWHEPAKPMDYYYIKGLAEQLFRTIGLTQVEFQRHSDPSFHPGRCAKIVQGELLLGVVGELHPQVLENYQLPSRAVALKLDLNQLQLAVKEPKRYHGLPRYPAVDRDLAILVKKEISAADVTVVINRAGGNILAAVSIFDVYQGSQVPDGCQSIALSLKFQASDRTLTDEEVNRQIDKIFRSLSAQLGAELRQ